MQVLDVFRQRHRVEFSDTDMAGIIHFSSYFRYMEVTEHAFLRACGFSVVGNDGLGWPRVDVGCNYKAPLRFEDEVDVVLSIDEMREKSIRYGFSFQQILGTTQIQVATGHVTTVCVQMDSVNKAMKATAIPENLRSALLNFRQLEQ